MILDAQINVFTNESPTSYRKADLTIYCYYVKLLRIEKSFLRAKMRHN